MIGLLRHCYTVKGFFVLFSVTILMAAGGWKLWSQDWSAAVDEPAPASAPAPGPTTTRVPTPPAENEPIAAAPTPTVIAAPVVATKEPATPDETPKKAPTTGKKHDRQDALLAAMTQQLHAEAYEQFIRQAGMGMSRMVPMVSVMKREWQMPEWTSEELAKEPPVIKGALDLELIHRFSLKTFGNSNIMSMEERWKDHFKSPPPKKQGLWEIKSLDLVGLVMHETPLVYMSANIPQMKDLKKLPTRDLDLFESEGLEELLAGKDLYIRGKAETVRVLGPIKAGPACLKCHSEAKEGDMLGAFSYTLRPGQYLLNGRPPGAVGGFPGYPVGQVPTLPNTPKK